MEEKIIKTFRAKVETIDKENHRVRVVFSDETIDSYNEIIDVTGWMKHMARYKAHPVLLSSHTYNSLLKQIGLCDDILVEDGQLKGWLKYLVGEGNAEADWGWTLVEHNIASYSVGYSTKKELWWDDATDAERAEAIKRYKIKPGQKVQRIFLEQELLENSQVTIPANPNSLQECLTAEKDAVVRRTAEDIVSFTKEIEEAKMWEDKPDWTEIRYRVKDPGLFADGSLRHKKMSGVNIFMIIGKLKSDPDGSMTMQSLRFPKPEWTLEKAKAWVSEHKDDMKEVKPEDGKNAEACDGDGNAVAPKAEFDMQKSMSILAGNLRIMEDNIITAINNVGTAVNELKDLLAKKPVKAPAVDPAVPGAQPQGNDKGDDHIGAILANGSKVLRDIEQLTGKKL